MTAITLPAGTGTPSTTGAGFLPAAASVARRTVLKFARTPQLVVLGSVQGAIFMLIYRYVFGGAINAGGMSYVDFMVPGFITTLVLFVGTGAAAGVAEDVAGGYFDRLRSLPIPRLSVMAGRAAADTALVAWSLAVSTGIAFAVGFRLHAGTGPAAAAFGLCVLFGFAFEWMFVTIGLVSGGAQAAQGMSMLVFPLTFVSSAYVPVSSMPGWLQVVADNQPITAMVDAVRCLTEGPRVAQLLHHSTTHYVGLSLVWTAAIVAVFAPLSASRFARR